MKKKQEDNFGSETTKERLKNKLNKNSQSLREKESINKIRKNQGHNL